MKGIDRQCLYCLGPLGKPIFRDVRDRLRVSDRLWTFRRCLACGSATLDPAPSLDELLAAYPEHYAFDQAPQSHALHCLLYRIETGLFYHPIYRSSVRQVMRITQLRGGRMLDVGGGTGHRAFFFQKAGFDCTVLDLDERALQVARDRFGIKVVGGLLETVNLPFGEFDLITFYHVVEHLQEPRKTIRTAFQLLRPGGWIVVLSPVITGWQSRWWGARWIAVTEAPRHVTLPSHEGIRRLLADCGLRLRAWESGSSLDEAGVFALSLLPSSSTPIAYTTIGSAARMLYRLGGASLTLLSLPVAYLACKLRRSSIAVFFAQKPA